MQITLCFMFLGLVHCCIRYGESPKSISNFADEGFPTKSNTFNDGSGSLIDGNKERTLDGGSVSSTKRSGPVAWWMLTFRGPHLISEIRLWNVKGSQASFLVGASIYVDDVLVGIVKIDPNPIILTLKDLYVVGNSITIMGAGRPVLLAEVEVWGGKMCNVNIAGEGTPSQIDTSSSGYASLAIDGYTDGEYRHGSVTHTATQGIGAWWKLEFDSVRSICGIEIYNRMDCCQDRLNGVTIYVGDTLFGKVNFVVGKKMYAFWDVNGVADTTITIYGGVSHLSLSEVEVFECAHTSKL